MPAGARRLALRARRRWRGRCAPGACGEPDLRLALRARRYALGARRTALRAEGAARLCARRRSRWLPSPPRAARSAPMDGVGAARPGACCSPLRSCRGRGWGGVFQISSCTGVCGERFVLPQHMCRVSRRGAPLQPKRLTPPGARPTPRTLSARARLHAAGEGRHDGHMTI